ncbi:hypothetical protein CLOM_g24538 [Closterium sp. NIES-68]|nr:hypothetical protein CLOM_g24538 [Closterium sp. NIES-68]GJP66080.1 hypothetical protein CLOP_g22980 [Closterium sp. NIES-67]GJP70987.1 hypothetical protein CLOP_g1879 [Closterium sp. NIES-67]
MAFAPRKNALFTRLIAAVLLLAAMVPSAQVAVATAAASASAPMNATTQYRTSAAALACSRSPVAGFAKKVTLKPGLVFHWKVVRGNMLRGAIIAQATSGAKNGWISIAWTKRPGKMYPADAVVGNLPAPTAVKAYAMTGESSSTVKPSSAFTVTATTVARKSRSTVIRFTRSGSSGLSPINYAGSNNIVWAYSAASSQTFGYHGANWGSATINLAC